MLSPLLASGPELEQLGRLAKAVAIERAQFDTALQQALELLPSGLACCITEAVMALLDAQGAVGFGDQSIAADQGFVALPQPVERLRTAFFRGQQSHHHAGVEIDHRGLGVTSVRWSGIPPSQKG